MIVSDLVRTRLGLDPWWVALVFSELLAFAGLFTLPPAHWQQWGRVVLIVVALCNGLLIYSQASGVNSVRTGVPSVPSASTTKSTFLPFFDPVPWWPPAEQAQAAGDAAVALRGGARAIAQVAAGLSDLGEPIKKEIGALEHKLNEIRGNRGATLRALQAPHPAERSALELNLARLEASEQETVAMIDKLRAAARVIDPTVASVMLKSTRERLRTSQDALADAADRLERVWAPVWRSAPFKPVAPASMRVAGVVPSGDSR
jgi:hypothetical protein